MSRELERRLVKVETRHRVDGLKNLSDDELVARIADLNQQVVGEFRAEIATGRPVAEIRAEVAQLYGRFPDDVAPMMAALGILDPIALLDEAAT